MPWWGWLALGLACWLVLALVVALALGRAAAAINRAWAELEGDE